MDNYATRDDIRRLEKLLIQLVKPVMIDENEAAKLLGIKKSVLQQYVCRGKIPPNHYTIGALGKRFYYRDFLTGLKIPKS